MDKQAKVRNKKLDIGIFIVCLLVFITGCSKLNPHPSFLSPNNEDVYKIAVIAPQFGPYEALGKSIIYGAELAVEKKNKAGGINGKKIHLLKVDDGGLASEGTYRAKSLVEEKVLGVIGHLNSDISIPASEIYSKAMIVEISPGSTNPFFTEREPVRGYVFRTVGRDDLQGKITASFVKQKGFKNIAVLYNDRGYGQSLSSEFVKEVKKTPAFANIVFYEKYKVDTMDFLKEINALKEKSPDLIYFIGEYGDGAKFLGELRKTGLKTPFLGSEGIYDIEFIKASGDAGEGALVVSLPQVTSNEFIKAYKEKYKRDLGAYSANSYDATNILVSAIEKIKCDKDMPWHVCVDKIAHIVSDTKDYEGLTGKLSFDEKGDLTNPAFSVYEVKSGMFRVVD